MATWRVNNSRLLGGEVCAPWQSSHAYSLGARCVCGTSYSDTAARAYVYECTTAGTSGSSEPSWPKTVGSTVSDGSVVWTCRSPSDGTWDNATCFLGYLVWSSSASPTGNGDTILVHKGHNETGFATYCYGSSTRDPKRLICVDADNSDALASGAQLGYTSTARWRLYRSWYVSGVTFSGLSNIGGSGVGTTIAQLEGCTISNGGLELGCAYGLVKLVSCDLTYSAFNAGATASSNSAIDFIGSTYHAGATGSGLTFFSSIIGSDIVADCSDLSDIGNGSYYQYVADVTGGTICIARCKLSASSTAELFSTSISLPGIGKCHHSTATSPQFENALIVKDDAGHSAELTGDVYRSATSAKLPGGVQSVSLKLASSAITKDDIVASISPPIAGWCGTTNARRFVIECLIDSAALPTKNDVRLLLELPGDANSGLGVAYWSSGYTLSPEDVEESDAQWEGTSGMSNPTPFRLVVEAASALPGPFTAWVYLYKASTTIYVDPVVTDYAP